MLSYNNDQNLKDSLVSEMRKHRDYDQIIKGTYGEKIDNKFKGCAVGCAIHSLNIIQGKNYEINNHSILEKELGIPKWLSRLQDNFFELLPAVDGSNFAVEFLESIPVGVDLEIVRYKFCKFLIEENIERVLNLENIDEELRKEVLCALRQVLSVHEGAIDIGLWDSDAAESARAAAKSAVYSAESSAWSAAWSAAYSAESGSAAYSAESVVWSAKSSAWLASESSAKSSAWLAAWSSACSAQLAAESAIWSAAYERYSKKLIDLLRDENEIM